VQTLFWSHAAPRLWRPLLALGTGGILAFLISVVSPANDLIQHDSAQDRLAQRVGDDCGTKAQQFRPIAGPGIAAAPALPRRGHETPGPVVILIADRAEEIFVRAFENRGPPAILFL
jgi:hypothetical protein